MFNCYLHGWSSRDDTCPKCIKIETVTTTTGTYPDYIVGISGQELERLRAENSTERQSNSVLKATLKQTRELLKDTLAFIEEMEKLNESN